MTQGPSLCLQRLLASDVRAPAESQVEGPALRDWKPSQDLLMVLCLSAKDDTRVQDTRPRQEQPGL